MAWLWNSYEEFVLNVAPAVANNRGLFQASQRETWAQKEARLSEAAKELEKILQQLRELGFRGEGAARPEDHSTFKDASYLVLRAVYEGEMLLLYHKRLAISEAAYGFLSQHSIVDHFDSYGIGRSLLEINRFVDDARELLTGYRSLQDTDERFLSNNADLPPELYADFALSRHLFSLGLDEVGLLIAGRGLEGILKKSAEKRNLSLLVKNTSRELAEADFHDVIEAFYHIKWKKSGKRLIDQQTKSLLHYLRVLRNTGAHATIEGRPPAVGPRETTVLVFETANRIWESVSGTRAHLNPVAIPKTW